MAKITDTQPGRPDGANTRLFGNATIGAELSRIHATLIRAGTELPDLLLNASPIVATLPELTAIWSATPPAQRAYLLSEKQVKKHVSPSLSTAICPDFLLFDAPSSTWTVIELKDGDNFDTKKSAGELVSLQTFASLLQTAQQQHTVDYKICCFNSASHAAIANGFKKKINPNQTLTGPELCTLFHINYSYIIQQRTTDQADNMLYLKSLASLILSQP